MNPAVRLSQSSPRLIRHEPYDGITACADQRFHGHKMVETLRRAAKHCTLEYFFLVVTNIRYVKSQE